MSALRSNARPAVILRPDPRIYCCLHVWFQSIIRAGSSEDAGDVKPQKKTKGKTGRPGR